MRFFIPRIRKGTLSFYHFIILSFHHSIILSFFMSCLQVLLCLFCPPLAVIDRGCGSVVIVTILWFFGWVPGTLAALIILNK